MPFGTCRLASIVSSELKDRLSMPVNILYAEMAQHSRHKPRFGDILEDARNLGLIYSCTHRAALLRPANQPSKVPT
jgi:hypothetical protein